MRLILGSGSPRRRELLLQLGLVPARVVSPDIDETPGKAELPKDYVARMAREKALSLDVGEGEVLLSADTTVAVGRRILGKAADADEARAFLDLMSGRRHSVLTAIAVRTAARMSERLVITAVRMKRLTRDEIDAYLATGDWEGKAGAYAIQGPAAGFIPWIQGSHSAVVGLPLYETAQLLRAAGLTVPGEDA